MKGIHISRGALAGGRLVGCLLFGASVAAGGSARAWDEDTCGPTCNDINPVDGECDADTSSKDPGCADLKPIEGKDGEGTAYDHATAHWEMTYAMARCVGLSDRYARDVAAADEATDMSSPYCGSAKVAKYSANTQETAKFYYEGYACGYELGKGEDPEAKTIKAYPTSGQTPAWLRWRFTDRCNSEMNTNGEKGHSEYFHYPYWKAYSDHDWPNLLQLRDWATGVTGGLTDVVQSCDFYKATSSGGCPGTYDDIDGTCTWKSCGTKTPQQCGSACVNICKQAYTKNGNTPDYSQWTFPDPHQGLSWTATSGATAPSDLDFWRLGIYLHSAGDYYSHLLCQEYSGQTTSTNTGWVIVQTSSQGPTTHPNSKTTDGSFDHSCYKLPSEASPDNADPTKVITREMCIAACDFPAHDCEFGTYMCSGANCTTCSLSANGIKVDNDLRAHTIQGLTWVWNALVLANGKSTTDANAVSLRSGIIKGFAGQSTAKGRQDYAASILSNDPNGKKQPCMCKDGVYGWKSDSAGTKCCIEDQVSNKCPL